MKKIQWQTERKKKSKMQHTDNFIQVSLFNWDVRAKCKTQTELLLCFTFQALR